MDRQPEIHTDSKMAIMGQHSIPEQKRSARRGMQKQEARGGEWRGVNGDEEEKSARRRVKKGPAKSKGQPKSKEG